MGQASQVAVTIRGQRDARMWERGARLEMEQVEGPSVGDPVTR